MDRNALRLPVILTVLLLALFWGGNAVALKIGLRQIPPFASAGLRFTISLLIIVIWGLMHRVRLRPHRNEWLPLLPLGILFAAQIGCFNWGTNLTHASRAVVMINTYPLFVAVFAHFIVPGDRLTARKVGGLILAFAGVIVVFRENLSSGRIVGDLLALSSGIQLALIIVLTNRLVQTIDAVRLLVAQMVVGVPIFFLLSAVFEGGEVVRLSHDIVLAIVYQGVVVGGFCFIVWTLLLKNNSPSRMSVLFFTTPLWGLSLSYLLLGDPVTVSLAVGAVLVALGIYLSNKVG